MPTQIYGELDDKLRWVYQGFYELKYFDSYFIDISFQKAAILTFEYIKKIRR